MSAEARADGPIIVCVDDDPINLRVFEANFGKRFRVVSALSGDEALSLMAPQADEIALLVTDHRMQGMTGVELLERSRQLYPEVQRFLITAFSDLQVVLDAVNRGQVNRYFVKPWNRDELLVALEESVRLFSLQRKLTAMEARLLQSERLATIGQVSAGIAHELMNPVGYVAQNVAALRRDLTHLTDYVRGALEVTHDPRAKEIVEDLPNLLRDVEEGTALVRKIALNVRGQARGHDEETEAELSEVVHFASRLAQAELRNRARLTTRGEALRVKGSSVKLCQVLLNLIVNAAQATDGTGRPGKIWIEWRATEGRVQLDVEDNGSGIPENLQEKIFEPLFTTKRVGVGTGLGLSICRDLVREMNGELWLESKLGEGTKVHFTLELAPPAPPASTA